MKYKKFRQPLINQEGFFAEFHYWGFLNGEFRGPAAHGKDIKQVEEESQSFIGAFDVNKKEVYAGDIIESMKPIYPNENSNRAIVVWDEKKHLFRPSKKIFGEFAIEFQLVYNNLYQVIGNVFETPDLYKKIMS